ncbi:MAG: dienelactone hydrolase family protein [Acidobacteriota bacterium]|nr:dienelactone hydrolase family protein [Blastocatellia bacterium]MDW8240914.1 dienelactone hydrolase family protein [Acidobacteriota bacterium]
MKLRIWFSVVALILSWLLTQPKAHAAEIPVSFKTEDGWTIHGMLGIPQSMTGKIPVVIFLHSYEHDSSAYGQYLYPGLAQIIGGQGVATLRFDFRGRGKSAGAKELSTFSPEELSRLYLDVRAALVFLASQSQLDTSRIGLVAEGQSAEAAVMGWRGDDRIKGLVLISGRLSEAAKQEIAQHHQIPLYLIVSQEDRQSFRDMAHAYQLTQSPFSRISVYKDVGVGTTMFSVWRSERPQDKPLEEGLAEWMIERLNSAGETQEVSFQTEDDWILHGTLRTPSALSTNAKTPAVIMLHSSFTDRHVFDHLAKLMVQHGLVALNIDTRGRGRSINRGVLLELPPDERSKTMLDAKAAVNFLASKSFTGPIGLVGLDRGASYALAAAIGDRRVGALVLMTTLIASKEREEITKLDIPIFYLTSKELEKVTNSSMTQAYAVTRHRGSRLLVYNGGALGYDLFEMDETLEATLAQWMKEQLSR